MSLDCNVLAGANVVPLPSMRLVLGCLGLGTLRVVITTKSVKVYSLSIAR